MIYLNPYRFGAGSVTTTYNPEATLAGWTERFNTLNLAYSGSPPKVQLTAAASSVTLRSYDPAGSPADCEIYAEYELLGTSAMFAVAARGSGDSTTPQAYYLGYEGNGTANLRLWKRIGSTTTVLWTSVGALSTATRYCLRFNLAGTALKSKAWLKSGGEPGAWDAEITDSSITGAGWVGMANWRTNSSQLHDKWECVA